MKPKNGPVTLDQIPGGHYTCQDNGDGTWNILDVPIMGEMFTGEKDVPFDLGKEWHEAALRKAEQRELEGHWGSTHVHHHSKTGATLRAGYLRLRRVGTCVHGGQEMSCLYADLLRVPQSLFNKIEAGELPYRSVEIASWDEPEIASLALMPDETPFFRLPMLTTGAKIKATNPVHCGVENNPSLAFASADKGAFILFNLGGPMAIKKPAKTVTKPAPKKDEEPEEKPVSLREKLAAFLAAKPEATDDEVKEAMGTKGEVGEKGEEGLPGEEDNLETGRFARKPEEMGEGDHTEAEDETDTKGIEKAAKLQARIDLLERKDAKRERADKIKSLVDKAVVDCKGRYLSAETKAEFRELAENDLTGKSLSIYVKSYKKNVPPDETGDEDTTEPERFGRQEQVAAEEPPAVAAFAAKGAEAHSRARAMAADYEYGLKTGHISPSLKLEEYLKINMTLSALKRNK